MQKFRLTIGNELSQIEVAVAEVVGPFQISEICVTTRPRRSVERLLLTIKTLLGHFEKCCLPSECCNAYDESPFAISGIHSRKAFECVCCSSVLQPTSHLQSFAARCTSPPPYRVHPFLFLINANHHQLQCPHTSVST